MDRLHAALLQWAGAQSFGWDRLGRDREDLVQQTVLEALHAGERLNGLSDDQLMRYLQRMLTNNLIDSLRKQRRDPIRAAQEAEGLSTSLPVQYPADQSTPSQRAERNERFARLAEGLRRLPDDQRIAVEMRHLDNARVCEIAVILNREEGAVRSLLHRAILALRNDQKI